MAFRASERCEMCDHRADTGRSSCGSQEANVAAEISSNFVHVYEADWLRHIVQMRSVLASYIAMVMPEQILGTVSPPTVTWRFILV